MKDPLNPLRFDVAELARHQGTMQGDWPLSQLPRLEQPLDHAHALVHWQASGHLHQRIGASAQIQLHLQAQTVISQTCQRCLHPVEVDLNIDRWFLFAPDEKTAALWDGEMDEDVLVSSRTFNLQHLLEDELVLALPLVPMHPICPDGTTSDHVRQFGEEDLPDAASAPQSHPFAALAALKKP